MSVTEEWVEKQIEKALRYLEMEKGRKRNQGLLRRRNQLRKSVSLLYKYVDVLDPDQLKLIFTDDILYGIDRVWRLLNLKHPKLEAPFHISKEDAEFFRRQLDIAKQEAAFEEYYPTEIYYLKGEKDHRIEKEHGVMFGRFTGEELLKILYCLKNIEPIFEHLKILVDQLSAMIEHMEHLEEDILGMSTESFNIDKPLLERTVQRVNETMNELKQIIEKSKKLEISPYAIELLKKNSPSDKENFQSNNQQ